MIILSKNYYYHKFLAGGTKLPHHSVLKKSLYVFYIGQNDFTGNLAAIGIKGVQQYLPDVVDQIAYAIKVSTCNN